MTKGYAGIVTALFLAEMAATFETSMLYAALPTLIRDFGDPVTAGWLVTIHMLVGSSAAILAGRLGDIKGRRTMMMALLAVSGVGSVISGVTNNFAIVFAGRALQGLSLAVLPLSIGILREALHQDRVPVAIGFMTTAQGMGIAVGLVLGGVIIDHLNWHWLFALSALLLAISWIAVRQFIPARPGTPSETPIDWFDGVLPIPGIVMVLLGVSFSKDAGWFAPQVWGFVASGLAIVGFWVSRSLRVPAPFIDLRILGTRNVALANAINVLLAFGTMQLVFVFSTYTQAPSWTMAGLGMSATVAGLAKLPSNFLSFFAGPFSVPIRWGPPCR